MSALLEGRDLVRHFRSKPHPFAQERVIRAVDGVSLAVQAGETLAIVGESGCGKSTLGRLLLGLIAPDSGEVIFAGERVTGRSEAEVRPLRAQVQMVFQDPFASLNPRFRVREIVGEPLSVHGIGTARERPGRVAELLRLVGLLPEHAGRFPHEFSGGQRQRIGIARALATGPRLIVGDEPVSALDVSIQAQIVNLLDGLKDRLGLTLVFISHDLGVVRHISDRVAVMYLGQIAELAATDALYGAPLHPYTQALLDSIPARDPSARRSRGLLSGDVPSPARPPPGCRFHTRCPHAQARCRTEVPALGAVAPGREVACHFALEIAEARPRSGSPTREAPRLAARLALYRAAQDAAAQKAADHHATITEPT